YRVFTPFYKKLRSELNLYNFHTNNNKHIKSLDTPTVLEKNSLTLDQLNLLDHHPWHEKLHNFWSPGEKKASQALDDFINDSLFNYQSERDIPELDGTSRLSAHLHYGEISVQQIITQLVPLIEMQGGNIAQQAEVFLRQLIWREFARYTLWHFPETSTQPMNPKFTKRFWKTDRVNLEKWQQGKTGIPIIDAGMKQLWGSGTMHNRVRMLVASLLTKNMGISWQQGANWFWDTLVDADLANNTMGWQWVAGCGVDAAPFYRIFNPETQAKKFDKQGYYINRWLDKPSSMKPSQPVVDLATSRANALDRYNNIIRHNQ
ncbi:MAG: DNA photolyase family protein, partial [Gammaproteobacteria bacterium]|nr:DNA photolyase family protein [Gammaproteobacteria bacterium]